MATLLGFKRSRLPGKMPKDHPMSGKGRVESFELGFDGAEFGGSGSGAGGVVNGLRQGNKPR